MRATGRFISMEAAIPPDPPPSAPRRKWKRWLVLAAFLAFLPWLNGPGIRLMGPRFAMHYLGKLGFSGDFELSGSLTGGLEINDVALTSDGPLAAVTIRRLVPHYELRKLNELKSGKLDGVFAEDIHVQLNLTSTEDDPDKEPLDLEELAITLRAVRGILAPVELLIRDVRMDVSRDGRELVHLGSSKLVHDRNTDLFQLETGGFEFPNGRSAAPDAHELVWQDEQLSLDRFYLFNDLGVENLVVRTPIRGPVSGEAAITMGDAGFQLTAGAGLSSLSLQLREGALTTEQVESWLAIELPVAGRLTSFAIDAERLLPDPFAASGELRLLIEDLEWDGESFPELAMDGTLDAGLARLSARTLWNGSEVVLTSETTLSRDGDPAAWALHETQGTLKADDVQRLANALARKFDIIEKRTPFPESVLIGSFRVAYQGIQAVGAEAEIALSPMDPEDATGFRLIANWQEAAPTSVSLQADGLSASGTVDLKALTYQGSFTADQFDTDRLFPWLEIAGIVRDDRWMLTSTWSGSGSLRGPNHQGRISLVDAEWLRPDLPAVIAKGDVDYRWPEFIASDSIRLTSGTQSMVLDAIFEADQLNFRQLTWYDDGDEVLKGSGVIPLPNDFDDWRKWISEEQRELNFTVQSSSLTAGRLEAWLPDQAGIDPLAAAKIDIKLSGTLADPVLDARFEATGLRSTQQAGIPTAAIVMEIKAAEGRMSIAGIITAQEYPDTTWSVDLPFRPAVWAENPEALRSEPLNGQLDLPRLDIARFITLVPVLKKLEGDVTGALALSGTVGDPVLDGSLNLANGLLVFNDLSLPSATDLNAAITASLQEIKIERLSGAVSGGQFSASGVMDISQGFPGTLDVDLRGDHLLLRRDEMLILRANANLNIRGLWERAVVSGTLGLVDSLFYKDIEILPIGKPFLGPSAAQLPKIDARSALSFSLPAPFNDWPLDAIVRTDEPALIRGNLARGQVRGDLKVGGTLGTPMPVGVVKLNKFRASLPFSSLEVRRGTMRFTENSGLDPILELRGESQTGRYDVDVYVHGKLSDPQITLTSNPPLPENEIMTLLATGTTTRELEDPQMATTRALQLLLEEIRRGRFPFAKPLEPVLKLLDNVDFSLAERDPYSNDTFSKATLKLADRWYVSAGMSDEGNTRVFAIWRISFR